MYDEAINVLKKINNLGYEAYIIGGFPRDKYLGKINNDIDISTNASYEILKDNFNIYKDIYHYGVLIIEIKGYFYEITHFRKEIYSSNRYPQITLVNTLNEDIIRRDFTINALAIDYNGNYIDLIDSKSDIDNKVIRVIGNINEKLNEDPLRILRAVRFMSDLNFNLEQNLKKYILLNGKLISNLSKSIINKELFKVNNKVILNKIIKELDLEQYII